MVTHGLENSLIFNHMLFPQVKEVSDNAHVGSTSFLSLLGAAMSVDTSSFSPVIFDHDGEKKDGSAVSIDLVLHLLTFSYHWARTAEGIT